MRINLSRPFNRPLVILFSAAFVLSLLLGKGCFASSQASETPAYDELTFPPLEVTTPDFERYTLDNGLIIYLMEDHSLPFVDGRLMFKTGTYRESPEQAGLAAITGMAMRDGGTINHASDALNEQLAQRAASITISIEEAQGTATFSTETASTEAVMQLFTEVVSQPAFEHDKVEQAKATLMAETARQTDDFRQLATRTWKQLLYGQDNYLSRTPTSASVASIDADAVRQFYQQTVTPQGAVLGISGDFEREQMKALLDRMLGQWEAKDAITPPSLPNLEPLTSGLYGIDRPQITQSTIVIGHSGVTQRSPYHVPMLVLTEVLADRMNQEIRSRQGLTYGVYPFWHAGYVTDGNFFVGGTTASETTAPFIASVQHELEKILQASITEAELTTAQDKILNRSIFEMETPKQTIEQLITLEFYGYPADYLEQQNKQVAQVNTQQVINAAQAMIHPEDMVAVVVGNVGAMGDSLEAFGKEMTLIDTDTVDANTVES